MANPFGKTRDVEKPYATYVGYHDEIGSIEVRILKRYKGSVEAEKKNQHSRWFTAARSDATFGSWEYGDQYAGMIQSCYRLLDAEPEWLAQYPKAKQTA
tara:strand:- start:469 stop:765 length:297 start_codon:yes stop_codon:yes gene_type:complete